jgi:hypothetical protein
MADLPTVVIELAANERHTRDLSAGGVLVPGCALELNAECELVVRAAAGELRLAARVVFLDPQRGAGLELLGFGPELKEQLAALAAAVPPAPAGLAHGSGELDVLDDDDDAAEPAAAAGEEPAQSVYDRLRHLPLAQQLKRAHSGDLQERILLERMYGKNVWEALLRNPRLTPPEVSRIARMGQLPRPLIEIIVNNGAWLQIGEVRRALLVNPRLQTDQILRVLRVLPRHELKLAAVQTSYPYPVRDAARRLLRDAP